MIVISGFVIPGCGDFGKRLKRENFRAAYREATGEDFVKGSLNIQIDRIIPVKEDFRILGKDVAEAEDFQLEICLVGDIRAHRIRPYHPVTHTGGHGDDVIEICCSEEIPNATEGSPIAITMFRDDLI